MCSIALTGAPEPPSPLVQGTHGRRTASEHSIGIIPANAGNTKILEFFGSAGRDHPR